MGNKALGVRSKIYAFSVAKVRVFVVRFGLSRYTCTIGFQLYDFPQRSINERPEHAIYDWAMFVGNRRKLEQFFHQINFQLTLGCRSRRRQSITFKGFKYHAHIYEDITAAGYRVCSGVLPIFEFLCRHMLEYLSF